MSEIDLLRKIPILTGLPPAEFERLAASLQVISIDSGEVLFRKNEPSDRLFIIIEGRLDVLLALDTSEETIIASLGPGEVLGEMGLFLPDGERTADVRASRLTRLWAMTRADFETLLQRQPRLVFSVARTLAKRLDAANSSAFRDLQEKNNQLQKAYDDLKAAQAQIIEKERMQRELQVAAEIQTSILPQELPKAEGYDFGACMLPARLVGGDFYDVFRIDTRLTGFVIGDVADKGVPSAIFMARAHALIMAEASHSVSPESVLKRVNAHLISLEQSDLFVTVFFGILDCLSGRFDYARAGHEMPLVVTADGEVRELTHGNGQALGVLQNPVLDKGHTTIPAGGTLLFFTDGATDCTNPRGDFYGRTRLKKALVGLAGRCGEETCDRLLKTLRRFQANAPQFDDVTLVAIHSSTG